jgi:hypothetical protein
MKVNWNRVQCPACFLNVLKSIAWLRTILCANRTMSYRILYDFMALQLGNRQVSTHSKSLSIFVLMWYPNDKAFISRKTFDGKMPCCPGPRTKIFIHCFMNRALLELDLRNERVYLHKLNVDTIMPVRKPIEIVMHSVTSV